jgi:nitrate reductase NapAB chaperone NapD
MKVKELIEKLSKFDGELEVYTSLNDGAFVVVTKLEESEVCLEKELVGDNYEDFEDLRNDEGDWIGGDVVVINLEF